MNAITKALTKALEADPGNWETRQALIEAYVHDGQMEDARQLLAGIEVLPEDESSLLAAAMCYAVAGATGDAREIVKGTLERNPSSAEGHATLATIAHWEGDSRTALRHYVTATSLDPNLSAPQLEKAYGTTLDSLGIRSDAAIPSARPIPLTAVTPTAVDPEPEPIVLEELPRRPEIDRSLPEPEPEPVLVVLEAEEADEEIAPTAEVKKVVVTPVPMLTRKAAPPGVTASTGSKVTAGPVSPVPEKHSADAVAVVQPEDASPVVAVESSESGEEIALEGEAPDELAEIVRHSIVESERALARAKTRDKFASLTLTLLIHAGLFLFLGLVVFTVQMDVPPSLVAIAVPADSVEKVQQKTLQKSQLRESSARPMSDIVTADAMSNLSMPMVPNSNGAFNGTMTVPTEGMDFSPSMSFGEASMSGDSKMMFGQKLDGRVLGVVLDVSGSMAEYLPAVVREVDKNFKNAPIVYVNHAGVLGKGKDTEIYGIVPDEVRPSWPKEWGKGTISPYWFLWGDLPRKAEQHYVDRLIKTFKTRPNMFIARRGQNLVGAAAEFLIQQKVDSLYIFSDFEDFVDPEIADVLGQKLGRSKVKTYVQPAAARTEHLRTMSKELCDRSLGREMPPLTSILRPDDRKPIAVEVVKTVEVPGVQYATPRTEMKGQHVIEHWWRYQDDATRFKDILHVAKYPNFDIVIRGPEARADLYLKNKDGYLQSPVTFGYHSYNPYKDEKDGRMYYPRRKCLRLEEPPKFDGNEFSWKMVLEDEIKFEVILWFKSDSATATYIAQKPPNGEADNACIFFIVPPLASETKDRYFSVDFPGGLGLDDLRNAVGVNSATFQLPVQVEKQHGAAWSRLGFKTGENKLPYNVIYRDLPDGVREVTVGGPSFGGRRLQARTTSNNLLLSTNNRPDMELWEGFACILARPNDRRERITKTEAINFSIE
ncbi:MAG: tetratricopeptide repeat protein [Verrucomicrobiales bacterium]|nr:tetratricopeptide repeat protein [Verrucomicrobiales bacterium]